MMLPYVAGISDRIRKACRNYNIRVVFRSGMTFRSLLTKIKDPLPADNKQTSFTKYFALVVSYTSVRSRDASKLEHKEACIRGQPASQL